MEAFNKFLEDLDHHKEETGPSSYWHIVPWHLEENEFAKFLKKLSETVSILSVEIDDFIWDIRKNRSDHEGQSQIASDISQLEVERKIAQIRLLELDKKEKRFKDKVLEEDNKKRILENIKYGAVRRHQALKMGSLTLEDIDQETDTFVCRYPGGKSFELTSEVKEDLKKLAEELNES